MGAGHEGKDVLKLPPKERAYLHGTLKLAIAWQDATQYAKDNASRTASTCLDAIEGAATEASTIKHAVARLIERMDKTA